MATAAPNNLPLFYKSLQPLSSTVHADFKARSADAAPFLSTVHAVPITIDEFVSVQRYFPIIFSVGDNPVPLALMGLNEGVNVFIDAAGKPIGEMYIPAYVRRYPFMLARLQQGKDELSLCFDAESGLVGNFDEGQPLFTDGQTSEATQGILKFCEEFEVSAQRTTAFMKELADANLLIDGEVSVQPPGSDKPFVYRGFRMVAEEQVRDLRGDTLRKMNQNGMLPLIMAHLFSLPLIRDIFGKQLAQGKVPGAPSVAPGDAPVEGALN